MEEPVQMAQGLEVRRNLCLWCERPISWITVEGRWVPVMDGRDHRKCSGRRSAISKYDDRMYAAKVVRPRHK